MTAAGVYLIGLVMVIAPCSAAFSGEKHIILPGARLETLAGDFKFTEGPASDAEGNVYFTDQPNDRILRWSTDGKLSTFLQPSGRSNGLCFDAKGNLWACADEKNQLWRIDPSGHVTVVVKDYQGKLLNGPNDVWVRPDGGLYFTDPFYKRNYWKRGPKEQDREAVYYLAPDYKTLTRVASDLQQPNGIIGTADGKILYVADIKGNKTFAYDIQADGTLKDKRLFCKLGSDGMTIDNEGNVYLTGRGVTVFDMAGRQIEHIEVPEKWTANVCFGGRDRKTLFITASEKLYGLKMLVAGVGSTRLITQPKPRVLEIWLPAWYLKAVSSCGCETLVDQETSGPHQAGGCRMPPSAKEKFMKPTVTRSAELDWRPLVEAGVKTEGIYVKVLRFDETAKRAPTFLLKFDSGASYPNHSHPAGRRFTFSKGKCALGRISSELETTCTLPRVQRTRCIRRADAFCFSWFRKRSSS
jgi:gluconolactonase